MAVQLCPVCACVLSDKAHEKEGVTYCCESCASGEGQCVCGCCEVAEEPEK